LVGSGSSVSKKRPMDIATSRKKRNNIWAANQARPRCISISSPLSRLNARRKRKRIH
jgi:ABC-type molybdate transport system ATPase subunit